MEHSPFFRACNMDVFEVVEVTDIHPAITEEVSHPWLRAFVLSSFIFVLEGDTKTTLTINPIATLINPVQLYQFYSLSHTLSTIEGVESCGTSVCIPHSIMDSHGDDIAALSVAASITFVDNDYWAKYFSGLRNAVMLFSNPTLLSKDSSLYPYYLDDDEGLIGLVSPYGRVLIEGEETLNPVSFSAESFITFPDALDILTDDEMSTIDARGDAFVNDNGVNVVVPATPLGIVQASNVVNITRRVPRDTHYTVIKRPQEEIDKMPPAFFVNYPSPALDPKQYADTKSSWIDYQDVSSMKKGVYR